MTNPKGNDLWGMENVKVSIRNSRFKLAFSALEEIWGSSEGLLASASGYADLGDSFCSWTSPSWSRSSLNELGCFGKQLLGSSWSFYWSRRTVITFSRWSALNVIFSRPRSYSSSSRDFASPLAFQYSFPLRDPFTLPISSVSLAFLWKRATFWAFNFYSKSSNVLLSRN